MAEESPKDYTNRLGTWGMYALAVAAVLVLNALINKYVGGGGNLPPPPPPIVVVAPDQPMVVKYISPEKGDLAEFAPLINSKKK
jgi:hypothetical protein